MNMNNHYLWGGMIALGTGIVATFLAAAAYELAWRANAIYCDDRNYDDLSIWDAFMRTLFFPGQTTAWSGRYGQKSISFVRLTASMKIFERRSNWSEEQASDQRVLEAYALWSMRHLGFNLWFVMAWGVSISVVYAFWACAKSSARWIVRMVLHRAELRYRPRIMREEGIRELLFYRQQLARSMRHARRGLHTNLRTIVRYGHAYTKVATGPASSTEGYIKSAEKLMARFMQCSARVDVCRQGLCVLADQVQRIDALYTSRAALLLLSYELHDDAGEVRSKLSFLSDEADAVLTDTRTLQRKFASHMQNPPADLTPSNVVVAMKTAT